VVALDVGGVDEPAGQLRAAPAPVFAFGAQPRPILRPPGAGHRTGAGAGRERGSTAGGGSGVVVIAGRVRSGRWSQGGPGCPRGQPAARRCQPGATRGLY
jgi:hypothetical protein